MVSVSRKILEEKESGVNRKFEIAFFICVKAFFLHVHEKNLLIQLNLWYAFFKFI
ncbi:hypothetical protein BAME_09270 [Bacillus sp. M 2-6]|nr:hypothetical protein BAME_09270 [Bacillus sp. M 2-6]